MNSDQSPSPSDNTQALRLTVSNMLDNNIDAGSRAGLERMIDDFPFFTLGHAMIIKHFSGSIDLPALARHKTLCALGAADRCAFTGFAGPDALDFRNFYPMSQKPDRISTHTALDIYDRHILGKRDDGETAILEKLIFNPTGDYSEVLARNESLTPEPETESSSSDETSRKIDRYLRHHPAPISSSSSSSSSSSNSPSESPSLSEPPATSVRNPAETSASAAMTEPPISKSDSLSESLAKFYIRQGRYERAFEIISSLSLKYPKKSVYFADQLRFLQKLMQIEAYKRATGKEQTKKTQL